MASPAWLMEFIAYDNYFQPCRECFQTDDESRITARDKQVNVFAVRGKMFQTACAHCRSTLEQLGYQMLQVRRSSHQDVVKLRDLQELYPLAVEGVQAYTINGHKVAFLRTRPVPREAKSGARCIHCSRSIQGGSLFCSLQCKVVRDRALGCCTQFSSTAPQSPVSSDDATKISFYSSFNPASRVSAFQSYQGDVISHDSLSRSIFPPPPSHSCAQEWGGRRQRRKLMHPRRSPS